jgi:hypothetical protein
MNVELLSEYIFLGIFLDCEFVWRSDNKNLELAITNMHLVSSETVL